MAKVRMRWKILLATILTGAIVYTLTTTWNELGTFRELVVLVFSICWVSNMVGLFFGEGLINGD